MESLAIIQEVLGDVTSTKKKPGMNIKNLNGD